MTRPPDSVTILSMLYLDIGGGARVRPRSPSPIRRGVDDVRPPVKRVREEGYYDESRRIPGPPPTSAGYSDYPSRVGSPPPPPPPCRINCNM